MRPETPWRRLLSLSLLSAFGWLLWFPFMAMADEKEKVIYHPVADFRKAADPKGTPAKFDSGGEGRRLEGGLERSEITQSLQVRPTEKVVLRLGVIQRYKWYPDEATKKLVED